MQENELIDQILDERPEVPVKLSFSKESPGRSPNDHVRQAVVPETRSRNLGDTHPLRVNVLPDFGLAGHIDGPIFPPGSSKHVIRPDKPNVVIDSKARMRGYRLGKNPVPVTKGKHSGFVHTKSVFR